MAEDLVIDKPTITNDSFDGIEHPLDDRTPKDEVKLDNKVVDKPTDIIKPDDKPLDTTLVEDGRKFLKEKLGYDDWDAVKNEIETLKTKSQTTQELKYENEVSEVLHKAIQSGKTKEVYAILDKQEKLEKLTEGEITKQNAPEIIKAAMIEKYKGLSPEMVNHKFNKQFSLPPKPKEDDFTTDDFVVAQNEWKDKVADIEMEMLIEANLVRPELEKLKAEIKLPEIKITQPAFSQTPEDLAKEVEEAKQFLISAGDAINKFEGFNVSYKNNDVEVQSTYSLSDEEKTVVLGQMKLLAEKNYNSNALFAERWVNNDNTYNFNQIAKDLATLETEDKRSQKFVSDTAAKVKEQYLRGKHNIDLGTTRTGGDLQLEDKSTQQKNEEAIWN